VYLYTMSKKVDRFPGVYMIMCLVNKKVYIGSSRDTHTRLMNHKSALRSNRHIILNLQNDYNLYGHDMFVFISSLEKLDSCDKALLREREGYWQTLYNAWDTDKGYLIKNAGTNRDVQSEDTNKRKIADKWYGDVCIPFYLIDITTGASTRETSIRKVIDRLEKGYTTKGIEGALRYWKHLDDETRGYNCGKVYKGYIFVREQYYDPAVDYISYKRPRKINKNSPLLRPPVEKLPVPIEDRKLGRKEIIVTLPDSSTKVYRSAADAVATLGIRRNKVYDALSSGKKYRGYSFSYTGNKDVVRSSCSV